MRVITRTINHTSKSDVFTFTNLFDVHYGAVACDEELFDKCIRKISNADDKHFVIGGGDYCDLIEMGDPRFSLHSVALSDSLLRDGSERADGSRRPMTVKEQLANIHQTQAIGFAEKVKSIADRFLFLGYGNHETSVLKYGGLDPVEKIAERIYKGRWGGGYLELVGGYMTLLRLVFKRESKDSHSTREVIVGVHHGFGGGKKKGSKVNNSVDYLASFPDAHIIVLGHVHDPVASIVGAEKLKDKTDKTVAQNRATIVTSSFLKTFHEDYMSYSEVKGYGTVPLGVTSFQITPWYLDDQIDIRLSLSTSGMPL